MFDFDGAYILYALGIILGLSSIFYFGFEILLSFSPVTKSLLLLVAASSLILAGLRFSGGFLVVPFYLLGAFSYAVFIAYTMAKFGFSKEMDFLLLALSSAAFLGLGYYLREGEVEVGPRILRNGIAVLVLVALAVSAVDATGPQPSHSLELVDSVNTSSGEQQVGTVKVENSFFLPRTAEVPRYSGCVKENQPLIVDRKSSAGLMPGGSSEEIDLMLRVPRSHEDGPLIEGIYQVEDSDSCPDDLSEGVVYIFPGNRLSEARYD